MGIMKDLGKSGMFGLAGLAATNKGAINKIARNGGLGLIGMALAKKKKRAQDADAMPGRPMVEDIMVAEEAPAGATMRKGGKVKKMAKGGSTASKRADGCATKGKTKGRFV
jgi:hypothetical protein